MYKINILKKAQSDLDWFRRNDKNSYIKSFDLVRELMSKPRKGTGRPERLTNKTIPTKLQVSSSQPLYIDK